MIEMVKYMMRDCTNNDQRAFVMQGTFSALCTELSLVIRGKDHTEMATIIETMSDMVPFMTAEMINKLP